MRWNSTIKFACGLGLGDKILRLLLDTYDADSLDINELILAIETAKEHKSIAQNTLKGIVNRALLSLTSDSNSNTFKVTKTLLSLSLQASGHIYELVEPLLESNSFATRIAAARLTIACGGESINLDRLYQIIQEILSNPVQPPALGLPIISNKKKCGLNEWTIRNEVLLYGYQLLLKYRGSIEISNQVWMIISEGSLTVNYHDALREILMAHIHERLKSKTNKEVLKKYQSLFSEVQSTTWKRNLEYKRVLGDLLAAKDNLEYLRTNRKNRSADLVFLESILRIAQSTQESRISIHDLADMKLVSLGMLFKGMGWWKMSFEHWNRLHENADSEAIDTVLKGMITVLSIDQDRLRIESLKVIQDIKRFLGLDFDKIENALKDELSDDFMQMINYLHKDIYPDRNSFDGLAHQIPKVPIKFEWNLVKSLNLSTELLIQALQHPSIGISQNAALLIVHGAGGEEAVRMVEEFVGVDEWEDFKKSLPDLLEKRYGI